MLSVIWKTRYPGGVAHNSFNCIWIIKKLTKYTDIPENITNFILKLFTLHYLRNY